MYVIQYVNVYIKSIPNIWESSFLDNMFHYLLRDSFTFLQLSTS